MTATTSTRGRQPDDSAGTSVLRRLLAIEQLGPDTFTATNPARTIQRLFGGQVAGQAVLAACRTLDSPRAVHSLHAYFIRAGRPDVPVRYAVDRLRDGRSFTTRRVTATQDDRAIFEMLVSFQDPEPGADWHADATAMPAVPPRPVGAPHPRLGHLVGHLDLRRVDPTGSGWRIHPYWVRADPAIGRDPDLHVAAVTYVSDLAFMANAREPGTNRPMAMAASIDHAMWFHRQPNFDEWLLFTADPVANIGARGMVRGALHTADGQLVATVMQEALLRPA